MVSGRARGGEFLYRFWTLVLFEEIFGRGKGGEGGKGKEDGKGEQDHPEDAKGDDVNNSIIPPKCIFRVVTALFQEISDTVRRHHGPCDKCLEFLMLEDKAECGNLNPDEIWNNAFENVKITRSLLRKIEKGDL